jgi:hypothetical protein
VVAHALGSSNLVLHLVVGLRPSSKPYRTLWPLHADALFLLGITS